ncbi:MAG: 3-hydroxyacyl-ACP dehydratase FabZ family protein [Pirellulales bacterium]|nr:3-hydroxyacyl-ACP dehydratase FabZ family protein [Pirellulales bacterium]
MPTKDLIVDPSTLNLDHILCDVTEIRRYNLQRFEMEQLTAIVYLDREKNIAVGYKDITPNEFWVRGHMPQYALMPGVIMCEAAAQLASFYTQKYDLLGAKVVGFGGLDEVSFRGPVVPGDRLILAIELLRCRRNAMLIARFQGFVRTALVLEGKIKGIPLPIENPNFG